MASSRQTGLEPRPGTVKLRPPNQQTRSRISLLPRFKLNCEPWTEWGQKTDFQASFNENHSELSHTMAYRSLFHSNQHCEIGVWQRRGNAEGVKQKQKTTT